MTSAFISHLKKGNSAFRVMLREDLSSSQEISWKKEMCKCSCLPSSLFQASNLTSDTDWSLFPSQAFEFVPDIEGNGNEKNKSGSVWPV